MLAVFNQPPGANSGEFFASLAEDLARFSDAHLAEAVKSLRSSRKYRDFPTIGECVDAARAAVVPQSKGADHGKDAAAEDWAHKLEAFRLCRCSMGRQAHREGWLVALFDYCREYGRLPDADGVEACRETAARSVAGLEASRGIPQYASLKGLREKMIARREKEIFGEPPGERAA
jgi:hypothetical protein